MAKKFGGQTAVITGAGGLLCSEVSVRLAKEGARAVLIGRTEEKLRRTEQRILKEGGECLVRTADVTDEEAMEKNCGGGETDLWAMSLSDQRRGWK